MEAKFEAKSHALARIIEDIATKKKPWWYGINTGTDVNSLSCLLGLTAEACTAFLVEVGWMKKHRGLSSKLAVSTETINNFIHQYGLSDISETTRFLHNGEKNVCFLRIGCFPQSKSTPRPAVIIKQWTRPRIDGIVNLRRSFRQTIGVDSAVLATPPPAPVDFTSTRVSCQLSNQNKNATTRSSTSNNEDDDTSNENSSVERGVEESGNQTHFAKEDIAHNKAIQGIIEQKLLPKIFKKEYLQGNFWLAPESFGEGIVVVLLEIASLVMTQREQKMSQLVGTSFMSPKEHLNLPTFRKYGIDATNKRLMNSLLKDVVTLSANSKKHNLLTTLMNNGKKVSLVRIPRSSNEKRIQQNDSEFHWVNNVLLALGPQELEKEPPAPPETEGDEETNADEDPVLQLLKINNKKEECDLSDLEYTACHLLSHLATKYPRSFRWAAQKHSIGVLCEPMDAVSTFAMCSAANVNYTQSGILSRHLRIWFGKTIMCGSAKLKKTLTNSARKFVEPACHNSKIRANSESVDWSVRDPADVLLFFFDGVFNRERTRVPWDKVDLVFSCDHGKGFSRAHAVFICRKKDQSTGEWNEYQDSCSLGEAKCRKDTYEILLQTFMPNLDDGFARILAHGGVDVWERMTVATDSTLNYNDEEDDYTSIKEQFYCRLSGTTSDHPEDTLLFKKIPVQVFAAGDIAQLMTSYGREGYGTYWCCYCNLSKDRWQCAGHAKGTVWTIDSLKSQLEANKNETDKKKRRGVKEKPLLSSIELSFVTLPMLHLMLGVINNVESSLTRDLQACAEIYTSQYERLEGNVQALSISEKEATQRKKKAESRQSEIKQLISAAKKEIPTAQSTAIVEEYKTELSAVAADIAQADQSKKSISAALKKAKKAFLEEASVDENTRKFGQQVRSDIEAIFKEFGINKASFHGGDIQGPACRTLMNNRKEILCRIWQYVLSLPESQKKWVDEVTIKDVLEAYERLLGHFDAIFSLCRKKRHHMTESDLDNLERHVEHATSVWRGLGMSLTPKMHVVEDHLVDMVRRFDGVGDLGEDEGERAHQTGAQSEHRLKSLNYKAKAKATTEMEAMLKDDRVQERLYFVRTESTRKRKKQQNALAEEEEQQQLDSTDLCSSYHDTKKYPTKLQQDRKKQRDEGRLELLSMSLKTGRYPSLTELRKQKLILIYS